ncbi:hypothetical protein AAE02nite_18200 [Adhaeribacter aerolatus]|uniref:Uncharacterized protein n=1 Tax=Adhaeribacter aerolatus TaxID=670289 RepID=A0A512AWQ6_9BACT|nr:hypothetical protein AAE02nite_18200 [Adhaeribacter aerolatus]
MLFDTSIAKTMATCFSGMFSTTGFSRTGLARATIIKNKVNNLNKKNIKKGEWELFPIIAGFKVGKRILADRTCGPLFKYHRTIHGITRSRFSNIGLWKVKVFTSILIYRFSFFNKFFAFI